MDGRESVGHAGRRRPDWPCFQDENTAPGLLGERGFLRGKSVAARNLFLNLNLGTWSVSLPLWSYIMEEYNFPMRERYSTFFIY